MKKLSWSLVIAITILVVACGSREAYFKQMEIRVPCPPDNVAEYTITATCVMVGQKGEVEYYTSGYGMSGYGDDLKPTANICFKLPKDWGKTQVIAWLKWFFQLEDYWYEIGPEDCPSRSWAEKQGPTLYFKRVLKPIKPRRLITIKPDQQPDRIVIMVRESKTRYEIGSRWGLCNQPGVWNGCEVGCPCREGEYENGDWVYPRLIDTFVPSRTEPSQIREFFVKKYQYITASMIHEESNDRLTLSYLEDYRFREVTLEDIEKECLREYITSAYPNEEKRLFLFERG